MALFLGDHAVDLFAGQPVRSDTILDSLTVTPSSSTQTFTPSTNIDGWDEVTVNPIPSEYIVPSGTINITSNGTTNVSQYANANVNVQSTINNQDKTITPTESQQVINADSGYTGLGDVTIEAISSNYVGSNVTRHSSNDLTVSGATITAPAGYYAESASKSVANGTAGTPSASKGTVSNHSISVTPSVTNATGYITGGTKSGTAVTVSANELVSGTLSITSNGTKDVTNYANVNVTVGGDSPTIETLTVTPNESEQTFNSSSVDGYKPVTVSAISSTYVGSDIVVRDGDDLTASGATVSVPAGYYSAAASKSVASGTTTAPTSISGTAANVSTGMNTLTLTKTVSVTPRVTTSGYVSSGTAGNSSVSLTANVTVDPTPTASGATVTIPAGYYTEQKTKSVSSGSATGPTSLKGSSATVTTGTNTLTLTKTGVTTTPTVSAGYISNATASTASVSLTANVTTKGAATITPGTTNQTINSGTYLTGTQTIAGDADLVAGNIKAGTQIFNTTGTYTSDATAAAADIVSGETAYVNGSKITGTLVVQKYYTGSSAPSSSLGNNGDIYIQA